MLLLDGNKKLPRKNRKLFFEYIFERCDKVAFHFPNFEQEYDGGEIIVNDEYEEYLENNKGLLEDIQPHIIQNITVKDYFGLSSSYPCSVYIVKLTDSIKMHLIKHKNIFKWQYPKLPEDLCFFLKNSDLCWMRTIAHEGECEIYNENDEDLKIFQKCGISYCLAEDDWVNHIPQLGDLLNWSAVKK